MTLPPAEALLALERTQQRQSAAFMEGGVSVEADDMRGKDELRACRPAERLTLASARRSDSGGVSRTSCSLVVRSEHELGASGDARLSTERPRPRRVSAAARIRPWRKCVAVLWQVDETPGEEALDVRRACESALPSERLCSTGREARAMGPRP